MSGSFYDIPILYAHDPEKDKPVLMVLKHYLDKDGNLCAVVTEPKEAGE